MFLKFTEIYEDIMHHHSAIGKKRWLTREIAVNVEQVSVLRTAEQINIDEENASSLLLNSKQEFSRLTISKGMTGSDIIVLGSLDYITEYINRNGSDKKKTLKG